MTGFAAEDILDGAANVNCAVERSTSHDPNGSQLRLDYPLGNDRRVRIATFAVSSSNVTRWRNRDLQNVCWQCQCSIAD